MLISLFRDARDNVPKPLECTWESFCGQLLPHDYSFADKLSSPAFSPAEYAPGAIRDASNVLRVWMFVADVDHVDKDTALRTLAIPQKFNLAAAAYSTWRHAEDPWRFRIVHPLSRPVLPSEWLAFWRTMNAAYGGVCDKKCTDVSRIYFGAYAPRGTEQVNFQHIYPGSVIDVDEVLSMSSSVPELVVAAQVPLNLTKLSRDSLERYAKQLKQKSSDYLSSQGSSLLQVVKGDPFAEPGERDNTIFRLSCLLGERFTDCDPYSIAEHFAASLQLMGQYSPDCPTVHDVAYKIERAQAEERAKQEAVRQADEQAKAVRIKEAFGNCRSHGYTKEEIEALGPNVHKRWVVQHDSSFYLLFLDGYRGPFTDKVVSNAAAIHLSPAAEAGVQLYEFSKEGKPVFKNVKQLVDQYGTVADDLITSLSAQKSVYDEENRQIIEAPCKLRNIKPVFHQDINDWLELMCWGPGPIFENLKTWLAMVPNLDRICSALFLTGRKSVGKSMLAQGVGRLWTVAGPTSLEAALSPFNSELVRCPFVFADEHLPRDFRGYTKFDELREFIQQTNRTFRRKFLPDSRLVGATRTLIAAHDKTILRTNQTTTEEENEATAERFFHIATNPAAAKHLAELRPTTYERGWVDQDKIAEHVMWLHFNHKHESQGRFYVQVPDETLFRALSTQSGVKGGVCQWLVSFVLNPAEFHKSAYSNLWVRIKNGKLYVNAKGVQGSWNIYIGKQDPCPTLGLLSRAVRELSVGDERVKMPDKNGIRTYYREIEIKNLLAWNEATDFADPETLLEHLRYDTRE